MSERNIDSQLFNDSLSLPYDIFQTKYRGRFDYIFDARHRFDESQWSCNCLKVDDRFFALFKDWRNGGAVVGGDVRNRYLCLLERSYLRRILKPDTGADELYWNLYEEVYGQGYYYCRRAIDNSDGAINRGHMKEIAERVMEKDCTWIWEHYSEDIELLINYWKQEHPNGIIARGPDKRGAIRDYTYDQVQQNYDYSATRQENIEALEEKGLSVSESYLYQHNFGTREMKAFVEQQRQQNGLPSTKGRTQQYIDRKRRGEVLSRLSFDEALELFPDVKGETIAETKSNFQAKGYQVSRQTICKLNNADAAADTITTAAIPDSEPQSQGKSTFNFQTPSFFDMVNPLFYSSEGVNEEPYHIDSPTIAEGFPMPKVRPHNWMYTKDPILDEYYGTPGNTEKE